MSLNNYFNLLNIIYIMDYLGIDREQTMPVVNHLNKLLADFHIYYQNLRNFHWNVQGKNFFELHRQFEELYNDARVKIDEIAERVLTLRFRPLSRITDYMNIAGIPEAELEREDVKMVMTILENHKVLIEQMRQVIESAGKVNDEGTVDMITAFMSDLEKKSWMLDAWATRIEKPMMTN